MARDPLVHFLGLGVLLFGFAWAWRHTHDPRVIVVDQATVEQISADYQRRFGASPDPQQMRIALSRYIGEEALYREGLARGLDRDDELVRRRIIQKMQFLQDDAAAARDPTDGDLRRYYAQHLAQYSWPARVTFHHIYFNTDHGDAVAEARAIDARARLAAGALETGVGDPFFDRTSFTNVSEDGVRRVFGQSPISQALFQTPVGAWSAPVKSGFGVHLLRVDQRTPAEVQPFDAVRGQIASDYRRDAQEARSEKGAEAVVAKYKVILKSDAPRP